MRAADWPWVLCGVLLNAAAQLLLKAGAASVGPIEFGGAATALLRTGFSLASHPAVLGGLVCYAVSVAVWIVALSRVDVSVAYPMLSLGYVVNALLAAALFGERVAAQRWLGIAVILVGVALVARSGSRG